MKTPCVHPLVALLGILLVSSAAQAQTAAAPTELSPVLVTATRSAEAAGYVPFSHVTLEGDALRASPHATLDAALRGVGGFSLFRRSDSLTAHPTAQGVSLRGIGPSGASRSLILLDGVPLNDPFGGWVAWTKVPRESLARVELVPGGGAAAWGNAALGGVMQLFTEAPLGRRQRLIVRGGSLGTRDAEAQLTEPLGRGTGTLQLLGRYFETDGFHTVAPERRGPIDTRAGARARWGAARWRQAWGDDLAATLTVRRFAEDRRNGTPYQQNRTDETFASLAVAARASASFQWNATAYAQSQDFSSTFSSVNAARTAETPASNQFSVPATATGLAWVGEWTPTADALTTFGADVRDTRGETREDSAFVSNAFTRRRFAGGRQTTAGAFLLHSRALLRDARLAVGLRADRWAETDGHRRDSLNGAQVADERFRDRDGVELSPSLGLVVPLRPGLRLHASGQHAFRRPTLNELYRPFRVGNVITDANPALRTERITSGELALRGESGPFRVGAAAFVNELRDAVGNVTVAQGPGNFPGIGFVPPGGEGRRRLNLDRVRVQGVSFEASWQLAPALSADAHSLWNDARVRRATVAPALRGLRLAQVPRHSAALGFTWKHDRWSFAPRARYLGRQFEDDLNQLRLGAAVVVDASLRYALDAHTEFFASAENLLDDRVETGRSAEGLVNLGTPRLILIGVRLQR